MRTSIIWLSLLTLAACDGAAPPSDGGIVEVDAEVEEGDFAVHVQHRDSDVVDGSELAVDFGCQGGSHVQLDIRTTGVGAMRGAMVLVEIFGGPYPVSESVRLHETADGAEALGMIAPFGGLATFTSVSDFVFPTAGTLIVSVSDAAGAQVRFERPITLVEGTGCVCSPGIVPGVATVSAFTVTGEGTECAPVEVGIDLTWAPEDPDAWLIDTPPTHHNFMWPASCVDDLTLEVGASVPLEFVQSAFPGMSCGPPAFQGPTFDDFPCACPTPGG